VWRRDRFAAYLRLVGFFRGLAFGSCFGGSAASIFITASSNVKGASVKGLPVFPVGLGLCSVLFIPHILSLV
jgi:hypothetical protein